MTRGHTAEADEMKAVDSFAAKAEMLIRKPVTDVF
jgi:hypothetical protein